MAIDGAMLHLVGEEIKEKLLGAKVDKIHQPSREELVFVMRGKCGNYRLLISARASCPRICLTAQNIENPARPPMLCMLLRKRLTGARLSDVRQAGLDRILMLDFEGFDELGDRQILTLIVEIMGRCSNAVLVEQNGRVIDALKRVDGAMSSARMILPGMTYMPPPAQDKLNMLDCSAEDIAARILEQHSDRLDKAILSAIQGISPVISREIAWRCCKATDVRVEELTQEQRERLVRNIGKLSDTLRDGKGFPTMICERGGKPLDLSFIHTEQYGSEALVKGYNSFSELLDAYCSERELSERMKVKSHDVLRLLTNAGDRISRKLTAQKKELERAKQRDELRLYGDLINANIYRLNKGDVLCELENFYSEQGEKVRISLSPLLTPAQNAQAYYKEYRKAQTAEAHLLPLIEQGERELEYIDTVFDALTRATSNAEVAEIRAELSDEGYVKNKKQTARKQPAALPPIKYVSDDGFEILVGRNNRQNEKLSLKTAAKNDIWLHATKTPGSHVIIRALGEDVPDSTIEQAAILAALHSRARDSGLVAVDYTLARLVTRQPDAKVGMVNYTGQRTVYVKPDASLAERLRK